MTSSISVVTPSFQQGRFIERTIRSVLEQGVPVEYLVQDGGSTDETVAILARYERRLRWVSGPDGGQADAVNKGIQETSGDIVGWLNSDDVYYAGALEAVLAYFEDRPEVDLVYGDADHIDEHDAVIEAYNTEDWDYERLTQVCFICQPAVFFRRRVFGRVGLLDARLRYCMDYEFWLRAGREINVAHLPRKLAGSRMYAANKTLRDRVPAHSEINDMLRATLGRVPTCWLYYHAFAIVDSRGYQRSRPRSYVWLLSWATVRAFLRWRRTLPVSVLLGITRWVRQAYAWPQTGAGLGLPS